MIKTKRFYLRELNEKDATPRYLSWFKDPELSKNIIDCHDELQSLKNYILAKSKIKTCLFFGIFCIESHEHIGNIKYEPINSGFSIMGILIGEKNWRGKGVAAEVIVASSKYLQAHRNVVRIYLGVKKSNLKAISAYEKIGFEIDNSDVLPVKKRTELLMHWSLA